MSSIKLLLNDDEDKVYMDISIFDSEGNYIFRFSREMETLAWFTLNAEEKAAKIKFNFGEGSLDQIDIFFNLKRFRLDYACGSIYLYLETSVTMDLLRSVRAILRRLFLGPDVVFDLEEAREITEVEEYFHD